VDLDQYPKSEPLLDFKGKKNAVDELVCFQEAQTLPLFVIRLKDNGSLYYLLVFSSYVQLCFILCLSVCSVLYYNG